MKMRIRGFAGQRSEMALKTSIEQLQELLECPVYLDTSLYLELEESTSPSCIGLCHSNDASFGSTHPWT